MEFTVLFIKLFFHLFKLALPIVLLMVLLVIAVGQIAGRRESWGPGESLYWSFITATTVGYGDMRPVNRLSRLLAVLIAFCGLMFTGILVAVTITATTYAIKSEHGVQELEQIVEQSRN